jgi:transcriptional regulator with XRE-family HTH domain
VVSKKTAEQRSTVKSLYRPEYRAALDILRQLREHAGMTQAELAEQIGRTQTFTSSVERGATRVDSLQIYAWVRACGATMEQWGRMMDQALATPSLPPERGRKAKD